MGSSLGPWHCFSAKFLVFNSQLSFWDSVISLCYLHFVPGSRLFSVSPHLFTPHLTLHPSKKLGPSPGCSFCFLLPLPDLFLSTLSFVPSLQSRRMKQPPPEAHLPPILNSFLSFLAPLMLLYLHSVSCRNEPSMWLQLMLSPAGALVAPPP